MKTLSGRWKIASRVADVIWPPRSLLSDKPVPRLGVIEASLWTTLEFLSPPWCACCGFPFETWEAETALCGACAAEPPPYKAARAALAYGDTSRTLVLDLKRSGRRDGLPAFAGWMIAAAGPMLDAADVIVPVPLHWTRLAARRFNQSAWLAQSIAKRASKPLLVDALMRVKRRRSQGGLSALQRRRNVQGAFAARPSALPRLAGRSVLLIDDVFTTGATIEACARALLKAKAAEVVVLTLARVVRGMDPSI